MVKQESSGRAVGAADEERDCVYVNTFPVSSGKRWSGCVTVSVKVCQYDHVTVCWSHE